MSGAEPTPGAVVLAGGASRRMGQPKAWISIAGTPLLRHVVDALRLACPTVWVIARPGQDLPPLPDEVYRLDDPPARADAGPLGGLLTGFEAAHDAGITCVYCSAGDAVALRTEHAQCVVGHVLAKPQIEAAVPVSEIKLGRRVLHGLAAAVRVAPAIAAARQQLDTTDYSLQSFYRRLHVLELRAADLPDARILQPCNTPQELWAALENPSS